MKKGFTLIELLAVIIILGVLSVIIVPKMQKSIKDSKKSTYEASAYALDREADVFYTNTKMNLEQFNGCEYNFGTNNNTCNGFEFKGKEPDSGTLKISDKGATSFALQFDEYCYIKNSDSDEITVQQYNSQTCKTGGLKLISDSDGNNILSNGDEVAIGNEHFYIINVGTSEVTMLAKYNLNVGYEITGCNDENNYVCSASPIPITTPGYGIQSVDATGWTQEGEQTGTYKGTIAFSENEYWDDGTMHPKSSYGSKYPVYAYDENSNLYEYIENYVSYLKKLGAPGSTTGGLLSFNDLEIFGCEFDDEYCIGVCPDNIKSWVYSTSYWLGETWHTGTFTITPLGFFKDDAITVEDYYNHRNEYIGLRPLIIISKNDLPEIQQGISGTQGSPGNR